MEALKVKLKTAKNGLFDEEFEYSRSFRTLKGNYDNVSIQLMAVFSLVEYYFASKLNSNNGKLFNRIFEKNRIEKQGEILEEERIVLSALKNFKDLLVDSFDNLAPEKESELIFPDELMEFFKSNWSKEFGKLLSLLEIYRGNYRELSIKLLACQSKKTVKKEEVEKLEQLLESLEQRLRQLNNQIDNNPFDFGAVYDVYRKVK